MVESNGEDRHSGPLGGVRVVELAGIGPCPFAAMLLADLGADVVRIERPSAVTDGAARYRDLLQRGKRSMGVDVKHPGGVELVLRLAAAADVLVEGFRPGVMERLGLGPAECLSVNPQLVYGRMTGWGQSGPLSRQAGHDIDYLAISGVLGLIGRANDSPVPPLNLVGDFGGGGMLLALGVAAALFDVARGARGQVVDAAMVDGSALLSVMVWSLRAGGLWDDRRGHNLIDTGAPFYEVYECADGGYIAVGALEPRFYAALCRHVGIEESELPPQRDKAAWPETKRRFAALFRSRPRAEWVALAESEGGDACIAPVLSLEEAARHPHNVARATFSSPAGLTQPAAAPRFSNAPESTPAPPCAPGEGGREALSEWGIEEEDIGGLIANGVVRVSPVGHGNEATSGG